MTPMVRVDPPPMFSIEGDIGNVYDLKIRDVDNNVYLDDVDRMQIHVTAGEGTVGSIVRRRWNDDDQQFQITTVYGRIVPRDTKSGANRRDFWGPKGWKVDG